MSVDRGRGCWESGLVVMAQCMLWYSLDCGQSRLRYSLGYGAVKVVAVEVMTSLGCVTVCVVVSLG